MSNSLINNMRAMQLPPIAKTVLWVLCDVSNDKGETFNYAPLSRLIAETCYKRDAVIRALAWLESVGLITANRDNGRKTTYRVTLEKADFEMIEAEVNRKKIAQSRTPNHRKPVDAVDGSKLTTSRRGRNEPVDHSVQPVDAVDTNPIIPIIPKEQPLKQREKSLNLKPETFDFKTELLKQGCDEQDVEDWLAHRKSKKSTNSLSVFKGLKKQADIANITIAKAVEHCASVPWVGFNANWYANATKSNPAKEHQPDKFNFDDILKPEIRNVTPTLRVLSHG